MRQYSLIERLTEEGLAAPLPRPHDPKKAARDLTDWRAELTHAGLTGLAEIAGRPPGSTLLTALFGNSPYLGRCLFRDPAFAAELFEAGPDMALASVLADLPQNLSLSLEDLMRGLRQAKQRLAVLTAVADISGLWPLERVTGALSDFAEAALDIVCTHRLAAYAESGELEFEGGPENSGYAVLGMGKLGGKELNYSSDIDLIIVFDELKLGYAGRRSLQDCLVRLTRDVVRAMQERTADGYVFRTDLRLRPDPGATPLAISMGAAESYYESIGLNWERAAMIKARPVAGDRAAGADFLNRIGPFVWRKNLDFAAIRDVLAIKDRIHEHHGHQDVMRLPGLDVKLGYGGIREVEFFAQVHQLVAGGRDPRLRGKATCGVLRVLARIGRIEPATADRLIAAYEFLRRLEHRLQMIADEQTHTLPRDGAGLDHVACFMAFESRSDFEAELAGHLQAVRDQFGKLSQGWAQPASDSAPQLPAQPASTLPPPTDPSFGEALTKAGFSDCDRAMAIVSAWPLGRYRAIRHERSRALLLTLTPTLLSALAETLDPDASLRRFDEFLSKLPSGVQFFSLLAANPWLLQLLAEIMGNAPRLAQVLSRNVGLLDGVLSEEFHRPLPDRETLAAELERELAGGRDFQDILDLTRRWANDLKFRVGIQVLRGAGTDAGTANVQSNIRAQSDMADCLITALLTAVEEEFRDPQGERHGELPGGFAVVALGKLGGHELSIGSDLDLLFLYDLEDGDQDTASSGPRPLPAPTYFARLSQRLINAISALTPEGRLYEVDMRLRPSGQSGPIAQSLEGFIRYHRESAWTWEQMALTRARTVAGPPKLVAAIDGAIANLLRRPRHPARLVHDVAHMRQRLRAEFGGKNPWNVKHAPGGLLDLEFIAQYLQLRHAVDCPGILDVSTAGALTRLAQNGFLAAEEAEALTRALALQSDLQGVIRLCLEGEFDASVAPTGLRAVLARTGQAEDFTALEQKLISTQAQVSAIYARLIEQPAAQAAKALDLEGNDGRI